MKKLLSIFFATALVTSSSLVATSTINNNKVVNNKVVNNKVVNNKVVNNKVVNNNLNLLVTPIQKIIELFAKGVDNGGLDSRNTYNDSLTILQNNVLPFGTNFIVSLSAGQDKNKLLVVGRNNIIVDITDTTTGQVTKNIKAVILGVYDYRVDDFLSARIFLLKGIDGSKYSVYATYGSLLAILQDNLTNKYHDNSLKLSLTNQEQSKDYLTSGTNNISFTLESNIPNHIKSEVINVKITNVPKNSSWKEYLLWGALAAAVVAGTAYGIYLALEAIYHYFCPNQKKLDEAAQLLQNGISGLKLDADDNTADDAIVIFQNAVDTITSDIKVFLNQDNNNLVAGTNSINVTITYNDIKENITAKLLNVRSNNYLFSFLLSEVVFQFTNIKNLNKTMYDIQNIINENITTYYGTSFFDIHLIGQVYYNDNDTLSYYIQNYNSISFWFMFGLLPGFYTFSR